MSNAEPGRRCGLDGCEEAIAATRPLEAVYCSGRCKNTAAKRRSRAKVRPHLSIVSDTAGGPDRVGHPCGNEGCEQEIPPTRWFDGAIYCGPQCRFDANRQVRALAAQREALAKNQKQIEKLSREFAQIYAAADAAVTDHRVGYARLSQQLEVEVAKNNALQQLYREATASLEELALVLLAIAKRNRVHLSADIRAYAQSFLTEESLARLAGRGEVAA